MKKNNQKTRRGVMICGAYGRGNAGDEAILRALITGLRRENPALPICVISRDPEKTRAQHGVDAIGTFDVRGWLRKMRETALYLSGGGTLLQDATSARSLWYYLLHLRAAKRRGCAVLLCGCGIGPLLRAGSRRRTRNYVNRYADAVCLRDAASRQELEALGVKAPIRLAADPALLLPKPEPAFAQAVLAEQGFAPEQDFFLVALRPWAGVAEKLPLLAAEIERAAGAYGCEPVLFALEPETDLPILEQMQALLPGTPRIVKASERWEETACLFGRMRAVLSIRLHPLIFAASQGIPAAGIVYDPKVKGFLEDLGSRAYCTIDELSAERLRALLDEVLSAGSGETEALRALRKRADISIETALALWKQAQES